MMIPLAVMWGRVPFMAMLGTMSSTPPRKRLYPVPTKTSTRRERPRVIRPAMAEQSALRAIMPSPMSVNSPLSPLPILRKMMPVIPMVHPKIYFGVRRSLLKNRQANNTSRNVPSELRMAARAPSLYDIPI